MAVLQPRPTHTPLLLLCESLRLFAKYIGQYRLSVCMSVCLFVCHTSYRPQFGTDQDYFLSSIRHTQLTLHFFLVNNSQRSRSRSPKTIKTTIWVITFESDVVETSGWLKNVLCRKPLRKDRTPGDIRSHVFSSREVKENITVFLLFLICFWKYSHISKTEP